jgi:radical SAM superfamily enzyme YgiQ (UPF0313 family)
MLRVIIIKPSKYGTNGYVERFRRGFMPNSTVPYLRSMTPSSIDETTIETHAIDEYVQTDIHYLDLLRDSGTPTLLALVGVQSHQFQRALDLTAYARANGVRHCVIGGPHPMTCDTSMLQNRGVSFALAEAEIIWRQILEDAIRGELQPVYGREQRWAEEIDAPVLIPPSKRDLRRYVAPLLGIYPARGCPFTCNFCSVIKIAGRAIRGQSIESTLASLREAKAAGVRMVMFTSDNFNKYPDARPLLEQMIAERVTIPFFIQCDVQISNDEELLELLKRAGCFQIFIGVESFQRRTLLAAHKTQNHPDRYAEIVRLCKKYEICSHFSNILGFPEDTMDTMHEHLRILDEMNPRAASFYVLTPIPGTEQYDAFSAAGWIFEKNMDRFDGQSSTWTHPNLSSSELDSLLFDAYRRFYAPKRLFEIGMSALKRLHSSGDLALDLGMPLFCRYSARRRQHPMSGGVGRVRVDSFSDYREMRKKQFGYEQIPLPKSLELARRDAELNRRVKIAT